MEIAPHITINPDIHHGTAIITGTRVPVTIVVGSLAGGMTMAELMEEYELTQAQIQAALTYAADLVQQTTVVSLVEA